MTRRVILQRALSNVILDRDFPISIDRLRWDLSGPGELTGAVAGPYARVTASDGRPLVEPWSTLIYVEEDGILRWGGIITATFETGSSIEITAEQFSAYVRGVPYLADYEGDKVDPADVVRRLWSHAQSFPAGNLGVEILGSTGVRIGTASTSKLRATKTAWENAKKAQANATALVRTRRNNLTGLRRARTGNVATLQAELVTAEKALTTARSNGVPAAITTAENAVAAAKVALSAAKSGSKPNITGAENQLKSAQTAEATAKGVTLRAKKAYDDARAALKQDGGAYVLTANEATDIGTEIDELASEVPFDFINRSTWNGEAIKRQIEIVYPQAGRRRNDLTFEQGVNISEPVEPEHNSEAFANESLVLGAGEGSAMLRASASISDGRLRRVSVISDTTLTKQDRLSAVARAAIAIGQGGTSIPSITVHDHPHAPIGSWELGDEIRVRATLPYSGEIDQWYRIVSWSLTGDSTAELSLIKSL